MIARSTAAIVAAVVAFGGSALATTGQGRPNSDAQTTTTPNDGMQYSNQQSGGTQQAGTVSDTQHPGNGVTHPEGIGIQTGKTMPPAGGGGGGGSAQMPGELSTLLQAARPKDPKHFQRLLALISDVPTQVASLNQFLATQPGMAPQTATAQAPHTRQDQSGSIWQTSTNPTGTMAGGGGGMALPHIMPVSIASIVGNDRISRGVINRLLANDQLHDISLQSAINNNRALFGALNSQHIDVNTIMAVDVLPSGNLEVYVP